MTVWLWSQTHLSFSDDFIEYRIFKSLFQQNKKTFYSIILTIQGCVSQKHCKPKQIIKPLQPMVSTINGLCVLLGNVCSLIQYLYLHFVLSNVFFFSQCPLLSGCTQRARHVSRGSQPVCGATLRVSPIHNSLG